MIAPREVRRGHDHQSAHVTVRRRVAQPCAATWTEKSRGAHLSVADAQCGGRCVGQTLRETHHHQVCAHFTAAAGGGGGILLRGWRDELEEEVFEVSFVHCDAERACEVESNERRRRGKSVCAHHRFCHIVRGISSSRRQVRRGRFVFGL
jgi:hypothetical protein